MKKIMLILCLFLSISVVIVFADSDETNELGLEYRMSEKEVKDNSSFETIIEPVETQTILDYFIRKFNQIIWFLKWISQPVSILAFMISALLFIINVVVNDKWSNIKGMVISVVAYACILFVNDIFMIIISNIK